MMKKVENDFDDESELLTAQGDGCATNTELLGREYYAMMELRPNGNNPNRQVCDKHRQDTPVLVTSNFTKTEDDVEHGLVPFRMRGRGSRWLSNIQCALLMLCFFIVFIVCLVPIVYSLKHAVTGESDKHKYSIIGN